MHEKLQGDSYAMAAFVDAAKEGVFGHRCGEKKRTKCSNDLPKTIRYTDSLRPN